MRATIPPAPPASTDIDRASFHLDHVGLLGIPRHELLGKLKNEHLTLEPTQQVLLATGVPSHIDHFITLRKVFDLCTKIDLKLDSHSKTLRGSILDVIDQKVGSEGGVKSVVLAKSLDQLKDELFRRIDALGECSRTPPPYKNPTQCLLLRAMFRGWDLVHSITRAAHGASRSHPSSLRTRQGWLAGGKG
jgi:hypothetical protein